MPVTDCTDFVRSAVIVVNTDVAVSQQVADYFCNMYGISRGNQVKLALGTAVLRPYAPDLLGTIFKPIADKVDAIGGQSILCAAGCPMGIRVRGDGEDVVGDPRCFPLLVGFSRRIVADGNEPYSTPVGGERAASCALGSLDIYGNQTAPLSFPDRIAKYAPINYVLEMLVPPATMARYDEAATMAMIRADLDHVLDGALASHVPEDWIDVYSVSRYRSAWRDFARLHNLPVGVIGYPSDAADGVHPGDLYDRSVAILEKSIANEGRLEQQLSSAVLVMLSGLGTYPTTREAWVVKVMKDLGFSNVTYWYDDAFQGNAYSNALAPPAQGINSTGIGDWNLANLDGTTTNPASVTYKFGFGAGFINNKETAWGGKVVASAAGGFFTGGASYGYLWGKKAMVDSGFSAVWHPGADMYNFHQGAHHQGKTLDVQLGLIRDGLTLTEAAFLGNEMSMLAVGNPLMRPFK